MSQKVPAILLVFLVGGGAVASSSPREESSATEDDVSPRPEDVSSDAEGESREEPPRLYLRAGEVILGSPGIVQLQVGTRYGILTVPMEELIQVRFARRVPSEERARIEAAVQTLGDPDFDRREEAMATLRGIGGSARRFLRDGLRSRNEEVRSRVQALLAEMTETPTEASESAGLEPLRNADDDEVVTRRFTIRGEILEEAFSVRSLYGELQVARDDLIGIVFDPGAKISRRIEVPGAKTVPENWLDTKFDVPAGSRVAFKAKGQLFLSNYNLVSGPEGSTRYSGSTFGTFPRLSLVGKIGRNGKPFLVGKEARMKVTKEGRLYLGVVPFNRNYVATGSFQVQFQSSPD